MILDYRVWASGKLRPRVIHMSPHVMTLNHWVVGSNPTWVTKHI
jgi:hypothetical protein